MLYLLIFLTEFILLFFLSRVLIRSISLLLLRITGSRSLAIRFFHILLLPGVVVHELAHLITAEVMLVRTGGLSFSLEEQEESTVLGSVGIEKTDPLRRAIIGFAPVLIGILVISLSVIYLLSESSPFAQTLSYILVFFIVFEVGNTMFSSKKDLEGTIELLFVLALIIVVSYFLGFRLPDSFNSFLNSDSFIQTIQRGIKVLLFPLGLDAFIILLIKFLS